MIRSWKSALKFSLLTDEYFQYVKHTCIVHCPLLSLPSSWQSYSTGKDWHAQTDFSCSTDSADFLSSSRSSHELFLQRQLFQSRYLSQKLALEDEDDFSFPSSSFISIIHFMVYLIYYFPPLASVPWISVLLIVTFGFYFSELLCRFNCVWLFVIFRQLSSVCLSLVHVCYEKLRCCFPHRNEIFMLPFDCVQCVQSSLLYRWSRSYLPVCPNYVTWYVCDSCKKWRIARLIWHWWSSVLQNVYDTRSSTSWLTSRSVTALDICVSLRSNPSRYRAATAASNVGILNSVDDSFECDDILSKSSDQFICILEDILNR